MHEPTTTILIADSDEDSRYLLRSLLELKGFQVLEANDGQEAIDTSVSRKPDLLLIQLKLAVVSGFTAIRRIRKHKELRAVPIIAILLTVQLQIAISHSPQVAARISRIQLNLTCSTR